MKTVVVDTNVLLRFLTDDVPNQARRVEDRLREVQRGEIELFIYPITIVELLFHLENWYKYPKQDACKKIEVLLSPEWMKVEEKSAVVAAIDLYKQKNIDFVDLLLWSFAKNRDYGVLSFDKDFDKLTPKIRVEP